MAKFSRIGGNWEGVDPTLLMLLERAAASSPYDVQLYSGYRPGDPRQHGKGRAVDIHLVNPKTGRAFPNYQRPENFGVYRDYANAVYRGASADERKNLRWGGYFSGGKGKYGALDLMHFDYGSGMPMGGGSWEGGLNADQAALWGLSAGGGTGALPAGFTPDQRKAALLSAIRELESTNQYDVLHGGRKFTDFSKHPDVRVPIGPATEGNYSSAAGAYQFITPTWDRLAKAYGLKDFSAGNQDIAAWKLAAEQYGGEEGLAKALEGDPLGVAGKLGGQWEALKKSPQKFVDAYNKALGAGATPAEATAVANNSVGPMPAGGSTREPRYGRDVLASAISNMGAKPTEVGMGQAPALQQVAPTALPATPIIDPQQSETRRQQLAYALQRLNSGQLWG